MVDLVVVAGTTVIVPLALLLVHGDVRVSAGAAAAGCVGAASFLFDEGRVAAVLVIPWGIVVAALAWGRVRAFLRTRRGVAEVIASCFLAGGAGWLVLSRYGAAPLGFGDTIVELTAMHFHYAGFVAPVVTLQLARRLRESGAPADGLVEVSVYVVLAATPITAAGITFASWMGAVGALLFTIALTASSIVTLGFVMRDVRGAPRALLVISALSVLLPMALAVTYAAGRWLPTPAPSIPVMVWTHGLLNAFGFALCGVCGWLLVQARRGSNVTR